MEERDIKFMIICQMKKQLKSKKELETLTALEFDEICEGIFKVCIKVVEQVAKLNEGKLEKLNRMVIEELNRIQDRHL